jgi:hypothetical protein
MPDRRWNKDFDHPQVLRYTGEDKSQNACFDALKEAFERGTDQVYTKKE